MTTSLTVTEVYPCILGESTLAGRPCTLVRLTGCNLRCRYCDSEFSFHGGERRTVPDLVATARDHGFGLALVTGGEPLLQSGAPELVAALLAEGIAVQVETGGSIDTSALPDGAHVVLDLKCPASGESGRMDWGNLARLRPTDDVKFVVSDRTDFDWALAIVEEHGLEARANVLFSPAFGTLDPATLAEWILASRVRGRLHLQIHKYVWEPDRRGV